MSKYIVYVTFSDGKKEFVNEIHDKECDTSYNVLNALLFDEKDKTKARRLIKQKHPYGQCKVIKLEKYDGYLIPIDDKINEIYPNHQYNGWTMLDWHKNTDEPSVVARDIASSEIVNTFKAFNDFATYVAEKIGEKHQLKKG